MQESLIAQEKNETSEIDDSPLITTEQIDESMGKQTILHLKVKIRYL